MEIAAHVLEHIERHAAAAAPEECCGLLLGNHSEIVGAVEARNVASEPERRYEIAAEDHFRAVRDARDRGVEVVGAYHSHPRSAPIPSATDRADAFENFLFVIAGRAADRLEIRAWRFSSGNFTEVRFVPGE